MAWWALKNIACVVCWTVLAIVFEHWWIALFGALFMTGYERHDNSNKES